MKMFPQIHQLNINYVQIIIRLKNTHRDEYFSDGLLFEHNLYLTGEFEGTFSYGSKSESSKGAKDGFVMQLPLVDPSIVNWFLSFGGNTNAVYINPINSLRFVLNKVRKDKINLDKDFYVFTGSTVGVVPIIKKGTYTAKIDKLGSVRAVIS